jgi:uncharacterized protein
VVEGILRRMCFAQREERRATQQVEVTWRTMVGRRRRRAISICGALIFTALAVIEASACMWRETRSGPGAGPVMNDPSKPRSDDERVASDFLEDTARGDWRAAVGHFDANMASALPEAKLEALWQKLLSAVGNWQGVERFESRPRGSLTVVLADARFSGHRQRFRVTVDSGGHVAGFFRGPVPDDAQRTAVSLVRALASGGSVAVGSFDVRMRAALPPAKALAAWRAVEERTGPFRDIDGVVAREEHGLFIEFVRCRMERARITTKVVFNVDGEIAGLFFLPDEVTAQSSDPPYVDFESIEEHQVLVGSRPALPGIVTVPRVSGLVPGVVLVHGSGPNDRDESGGGAKIFRDLALGLATRGIGVLRYDKRSLVDPLGVITEKEEVIDGALAAISMLRSQSGVDPARIVLLGHSQGGALAPRIAQLDGSLAGIVVLAGPTRPLQTILVAQLEFQRSLHPDDASIAGLLKEALDLRTAVQAPDLRPDSWVHLPGGGELRGAYFLASRGYHPELVAASLGCPILVLQGDRDYKVTTRDDFEGWRIALTDRPAATLKLYPTLDHRFVAASNLLSTGPGPTHVDSQVVEDIASWVNALGVGARR